MLSSKFDCENISSILIADLVSQPAIPVSLLNAPEKWNIAEWDKTESKDDKANAADIEQDKDPSKIIVLSPLTTVEGKSNNITAFGACVNMSDVSCPDSDATQPNNGNY